MAKRRSQYADTLWSVLAQGAIKRLDSTESDDNIILNFTPNNVRRIILGLDGIFVQFHTASGAVRNKYDTRILNPARSILEEVCLPENVPNFYGVLDMLRRPRVFSSVEEIIVIGHSPAVEGLSFLNSGINYFFESEEVQKHFRRLGCVTYIKTPITVSEFLGGIDKDVLTDNLRLVTPTLRQFGDDLIVRKFNTSDFFLHTLLRPRYYALDAEGGTLANHFENVKAEYRKRLIEFEGKSQTGVSSDNGSEGNLSGQDFGWRHESLRMFRVLRGADDFNSKYSSFLKSVIKHNTGDLYKAWGRHIMEGVLSDVWKSVNSVVNTTITAIEGDDSRARARSIIKQFGMRFDRDIELNDENILNALKFMREWTSFLEYYFGSSGESVPDWVNDAVDYGFEGDTSIALGVDFGEGIVESVEKEFFGSLYLEIGSWSLNDLVDFVRNFKVGGSPFEDILLAFTAYKHLVSRGIVSKAFIDNVRGIREQAENWLEQERSKWTSKIDEILSYDSRESMSELKERLVRAKELIETEVHFSTKEYERLLENAFQNLNRGTNIGVSIFAVKVKERYAPKYRLRESGDLTAVLSDSGKNTLLETIGGLLKRSVHSGIKINLSKKWEEAMNFIEERESGTGEL